MTWSAKAQEALALIAELDPAERSLVADEIERALGLEQRHEVNRGDFGLVEVTFGPHKGRIGEYDDDDAAGAIVEFPDEQGGEETLPYAHLRMATEEEMEAYLQADARAHQGEGRAT